MQESLNIFDEVKQYITQKQYHKAIALLEKLLQQDKQNQEATFYLGMCYKLNHNFTKAIEYFQKSIHIPATIGEPWMQLSECHYHLGNSVETEKCLQNALKHTPNNPLVIHRLAFLYQQTGRPKQSCKYYQLLTKHPDYQLDAHFQLALQLQALMQIDKAIEHYKILLELQPNHADACYALGSAYSFKRAYELAIDAFQTALKYNPNHPQSNMELAVAKAAICDWSNREQEEEQFITSLKHILKEGIIDLGKSVMQVNYFDVNPKLCLETAKQLSKQLEAGVRNINFPTSKTYKHNKIRIGYISPDFRAHAVGRLIHDIFRHHNRAQFEVYTYTLIPLEKEDAISNAIIKGSDHHIDCHRLNELEIAQQIRKDEIDVLIDMGGFTTYTKPRILAMKPAPVQMHYLGNPSSMGAVFTPHLLADRAWVPAENQTNFSEKIVYLDHAWICSPIQEKIPNLSRTELELPKDTFIYGSFNLPQKLEPETFNCWMEILHKTKDSILWIYAPVKIQQNSIKSQSIKAGIDPKRLYFAEHTSYDKYLAQLAQVDVFLDNFQYGAGSTAVNSLMMATPVLTYSGQRMVSRLGTAVNAAANMDSWNCYTKQEYLDKAIFWYKNQYKLTEVSNQLKKNIKESPLCRVDLFVLQLEEKILEIRL